MNKTLAAVSDGTRLKMLRLLARGELCACVLPRHVGTSQPAVSQHLKVLKSSHIVTDERRGQEVFYTVDTEHTLALLKVLVNEMNKKS